MAAWMLELLVEEPLAVDVLGAEVEVDAVGAVVAVLELVWVLELELLLPHPTTSTLQASRPASHETRLWIMRSPPL